MDLGFPRKSNIGNEVNDHGGDDTGDKSANDHFLVEPCHELAKELERDRKEYYNKCSYGAKDDRIDDEYSILCLERGERYRAEEGM